MRLERRSVDTTRRVGRACEISDKRFGTRLSAENPGYMTLALLGSIFIVLGVVALAMAVALPISYGFRQRAAARPSPRGTQDRAPAANA
jgi:hypothetical protein